MGLTSSYSELLKWTKNKKNQKKNIYPIKNITLCLFITFKSIFEEKRIFLILNVTSSTRSDDIFDPQSDVDS